MRVNARVKAWESCRLPRWTTLESSCTRALTASHPAGINFLSGGQSEEEASANLNAMNQLDTLRCACPGCRRNALHDAPAHAHQKETNLRRSR